MTGDFGRGFAWHEFCHVGRGQQKLWSMAFEQFLWVAVSTMHAAAAPVQQHASGFGRGNWCNFDIPWPWHWGFHSIPHIPWQVLADNPAGFSTIMRSRFHQHGSQITIQRSRIFAPSAFAALWNHIRVNVQPTHGMSHHQRHRRGAEPISTTSTAHYRRTGVHHRGR